MRQVANRFERAHNYVRAGHATPVRFDSIPTAVKSAPLLGEHTPEVLADWLGLDAAAVAGLRQDGIV
jgi:crotonobetainyl-CoA:carnitine CoA-transferase CaiB-like acyl-CoA transferase